MKKLRLDLDRLAVESFSSHDIPASRGTIHGRSGYSDDFTYCETDCGLTWYPRCAPQDTHTCG